MKIVYLKSRSLYIHQEYGNNRQDEEPEEPDEGFPDETTVATTKAATTIKTITTKSPVVTTTAKTSPGSGTACTTKVTFPIKVRT